MASETVKQLCEKLHKLGGEIHGMTKLSPYNIHNLSHIIDEAQDRILDAHKRELAAKDAEIAAKNALIKELADKLWSMLPVGCRDDGACCRCKAERCNRRDDWIALVKKARSEVK